MKLFINGVWQTNYLDEALRPNHVRIKVHTWSRHQTLDSVYIVRKASVSSLIGYIAKVGAKEVVRKIRSRYAERNRNVRWFCSGRGEVVEAGQGAKFQVGQAVFFLAPAHVGGMERVVLSEQLVRSADTEATNHGCKVLDAEPLLDIDKVAGWNIDSGRLLQSAEVDRLLSLAVQSWDKAVVVNVDTSEPSPVAERHKRVVQPQEVEAGKPSAIIFGLGNYAKTIIIPSVESQLRIETIYELDPLQIGAKASDAITWDTSPVFRDDDRADVVFVAGYHHTHVALAVEALKRGATVLIEKPAATTMEQVQCLRKAMDSSKKPVNIGFHRRYLPFNALLKEDLQVKNGEAVDYYCIVFEEPLPQLHWYGWPNSKTRLTSNGCHWIDHFLFINGFPKIVSQSVISSKRGTLIVGLEAENGAVFSMTLTDEGSARIGVQDHVECRANGRTVTMTNSSVYVAEDQQKVTRKLRVPSLTAHRTMYATLVKNMLANRFDDSSHTALQAAIVCLELEADLKS